MFRCSPCCDDRTSSAARQSSTLASPCSTSLHAADRKGAAEGAASTPFTPRLSARASAGASHPSTLARAHSAPSA